MGLAPFAPRSLPYVGFDWEFRGCCKGPLVADFLINLTCQWIGREIAKPLPTHNANESKLGLDRPVFDLNKQNLSDVLAKLTHLLVPKSSERKPDNGNS